MTWFELTLHKGPRLVYKRPDRNDEPLDVTDRAAEYLFTTIQLDSDATLGDVFGLLDNPVMRTVFRFECVNEILAEASLGPVVTDEPTHEKL